MSDEYIEREMSKLTVEELLASLAKHGLLMEQLVRATERFRGEMNPREGAVWDEAMSIVAQVRRLYEERRARGAFEH